MTSFSATCSKLSHYLKEQQRLAATARPVTAMSLLPVPDVPAETEADTNQIVSYLQPLDLFPQRAGLGPLAPAEEKAKLTIFYGGQVLIFNDFPADKAKDIMLMAAKVDTSASPPSPTNISAVAGRGLGALPMTRRASLHRFIEKRKERIHSSNAPYQVGEPRLRADADSTNKPVSSLPWFMKSTPNEKINVGIHGCSFGLKSSDSKGL